MSNYQDILLSIFADCLEEMNKTVSQAWEPYFDEFNKSSAKIALNALNEIENTVKAALTDIFTPQLLVTTTLQSVLAESMKPIEDALKQMAPSLNSNYQNQLGLVQETLRSFESDILKIKVHADHVDVPSSLIPDDFSSAEDLFFPSNTEIDEVLELDIKNEPIRKISIPEAVTLICTLITTLLTIISFMQSQLDTNHEQLIELQAEQLSLQAEENELLQRNNQLLQAQIDATYEQAKYLSSLLEELQPIIQDPSVSPEFPASSDSTSTNADSKFQYADSENMHDSPKPSTVPDELYNSETPLMPES